MAFTLVFDGKIRSYNQNPLTTETPFGTPYAASIGDSFEEVDILREALELIENGADNPEKIARDAFAALQEIMHRELEK